MSGRWVRIQDLDVSPLEKGILMGAWILWDIAAVLAKPFRGPDWRGGQP